MARRPQLLACSTASASMWSRQQYAAQWHFRQFIIEFWNEWPMRKNGNSGEVRLLREQEWNVLRLSPLGKAITGRGIWSLTWVGLTMIYISVPLSARYCWGRRESGRIAIAAGRDVGTIKIKVKVRDQMLRPVEKLGPDR